jgi:hypothetical protein
MTYARTRAVSSCGYGIAGHAAVAHLCQPQITLDCCAANKSTHEVNGAILASRGIYSSAVSGEGIACCEVQASGGPRVRGVWRVAGKSGVRILRQVSQHTCKRNGVAEQRTWMLVSAFSRSALGSGVGAFPTFWREFNELFTLPPGVGVWDWGPPRVFSISREPDPLTAGGGCPWPPDEVMSRVAGGSALLACCLLFLPKRKDMAAAVVLRRRWCSSGRGLSRTHSAWDADWEREGGLARVK